MLNDNSLIYCRICGSCEGYMPWGEDGQTPSFEICPCCSVQFGYEDMNISGILKYRSEWIKSKKFLSDKKYLLQLENIPKKYFL